MRPGAPSQAFSAGTSPGMVYLWTGVVSGSGGRVGYPRLLFGGFFVLLPVTVDRFPGGMGA